MMYTEKLENKNLFNRYFRNKFSCMAKAKKYIYKEGVTNDLYKKNNNHVSKKEN